MGRRGVGVDETDRWVFNRLASDYVARPGYPEDLLDRVAELAGGAGSVAVDLGAGTGLVSVPLATRGLRVHAVEPAAAMLRILEAAAVPGVVPQHAAAERTGLPAAAADLAILADALQWVDPAGAGRELARIVRSGGVVAVLEAAPASTAFMRGVTALVEAANFKARRPASGAARRDPLLAAACVADLRTERFAHEEALGPDRLDAVLRSLSLVGPAIGPTAVARLLGDARRLGDEAGGAVWARELTLTWGRRK